MKSNRGHTCISAYPFWQMRLPKNFEYVCILKIFFLFSCSGLKEATTYNSKPQTYKRDVSLNKCHSWTVGKLGTYCTKFVFKWILKKKILRMLHSILLQNFLESFYYDYQNTFYCKIYQSVNRGHSNLLVQDKTKIGKWPRSWENNSDP